jgi:hypothetical protein
MRLLFPVFALACLLGACGSGGAGTSPSSPLSAAGVPLSAPLSPMWTRRTKTYSVATTCGIPACANAVVSLSGTQAGTLSYSDGVTYFVNTNTAGSVTFLGRTFPDFSGTFTNTGGNDWLLQGTFSHGRDTLSEAFYAYGHSGRGGGTTIVNTAGTVITPFVTPSPTPVPTPRPTPRPTPTDS